MWWINNHSIDYIKNSILVVGLTDESRVSWYDPTHAKGRDDPEWNTHVHAQWLDGAGTNVDKGWFALHKYYLSMSACHELYQLNYETTVRMFDGIGARHNIPIVQFNALANRTMDIKTFYDFDIRAVVGNDYKKNGHPNEIGHEKISKKIVKIVDKFI